MNGQITSGAHSALEYIISKALLEGKVGRTTLEIPMTDIFTEYEGPKFSPESAALVLKLVIDSSWSTGNAEGSLDIDMEGDIEFDDFVEGDDESEDGDANGNSNQ